VSDPDSSANEVAKLIRRTEYHLGQPTVKSLMVARRKTAEDRISPQTQILYGELAPDQDLLAILILLSQPTHWEESRRWSR
jgi:hypothetical protein